VANTSERPQRAAKDRANAGLQGQEMSAAIFERLQEVEDIASRAIKDETEFLLKCSEVMAALPTFDDVCY